jgi:hypothetical protein
MSIERIEPDGAVIVMHARRGGFARLRYDAREVAQLIELDLLRLYVKPVRKERALPRDAMPEWIAARRNR